MTTRYLLPCACGRKTEVDAGEAGIEIQCQCGARLQVPPMRGLAALERSEAAASSPSADATGEWGTRQSLVFLGVALALVLLFPAGYFWYTYPERPRLSDDFPAFNRAEIANYTPEQTWEAWNQLRAGIKHEEEEPFMVMYLAHEKQHRRWLASSIAVSVAGALLAIGALVWPSIERRRKQPVRKA